MTEAEQDLPSRSDWIYVPAPKPIWECIKEGNHEYRPVNMVDVGFTRGFMNEAEVLTYMNKEYNSPTGPPWVCLRVSEVSLWPKKVKWCRDNTLRAGEEDSPEHMLEDKEFPHIMGGIPGKPGPCVQEMKMHRNDTNSCWVGIEGIDKFEQDRPMDFERFHAAYQEAVKPSFLFQFVLISFMLVMGAIAMYTYTHPIVVRDLMRRIQKHGLQKTLFGHDEL